MPGLFWTAVLCYNGQGPVPQSIRLTKPPGLAEFVAACASWNVACNPLIPQSMLPFWIAASIANTVGSGTVLGTYALRSNGGSAGLYGLDVVTYLLYGVRRTPAELLLEEPDWASLALACATSFIALLCRCFTFKLICFRMPVCPTCAAPMSPRTFARGDVPLECQECQECQDFEWEPQESGLAPRHG